MTPKNPRIILEQIDRTFHTAHGDIIALENITLSIKDGEFFSIVGPSGCGKTTLLRILAGLESASAGTLTIHAGDQNRPLSSVVFQEQSIFPWLTNKDKQNGLIHLSN